MERIQGVLDDSDNVSDITELVNQTGMCLTEEQTMAAAPVDSEILEQTEAKDLTTFSGNLPVQRIEALKVIIKFSML